MSEEFHVLEMESPDFTVVLDDDAEPYILLIVYGPTVNMMMWVFAEMVASG